VPRLIVFLLIGAVLVVGTSLSVSVADPGKSGRVKFVKRADNICEPARSEAKQKIDHGVRLLQRRHPSVRRAGRHFVHAWRVMREAYHGVDDLHRPDGYRKKIARWLRREFHATSVGVRSAIWLKRSHFYKARRLAHRAAVLEQDAARIVRNFDFHHCRPL
jgi:hypothetical protein